MKRKNSIGHRALVASIRMSANGLLALADTLEKADVLNEE